MSQLNTAWRLVSGSQGANHVVLLDGHEVTVTVNLETSKNDSNGSLG